MPDSVFDILLGLAAGLISAAIYIALAIRYRPRAAPDDRDRLHVLANALAASGDGVMIVETSGGFLPQLHIVYANAAIERMTGSADLLAPVRQAMSCSSRAVLELPCRRADDTPLWTEWQIVPVVDSLGRCTHWIATVREVTQRRNDEQSLRESEARFRALFEHAADAIFLLDQRGCIVDVNHRACEYLGYSRTELLRLPMDDLESGGKFANLDLGKTQTADNLFRRKDGSTFPVEVRYALLEYGGKRLVLTLVRDVTRRRLIERTLREREELLRNVIAHIPCAVFWKDRHSVYLGCNDLVAKSHGLDGAESLIGRTDYDLGVTPEEAEYYRSCDQQVMESGTPILNMEESQTRASGVKTTLLTSKVPLRDATGTVVGVLGVYQDITDRKRLESQLLHSQKMEAVGQLAGGIAHDFNNLLTVIRGNADLLRSISADPEAELVDEIRLASDRAAALVRKLLMFSRRQPARPEVLDLNAVVSNLSSILRRLLGERIAIETVLAPREVATRIDRSHLEQVIVNLAVNARDAMPDGGVLTINTKIVEGTGSMQYARVTVSDTGVGMSEAVKARIFEPFFSTKGPEHGSGLGLATVYGIVEQAGGQIQVESTPGAGTTFHVELPWCGDPASRTTSLPCTLLNRKEGAGRTVLLVEDEDSVRKFARMALENQGYTVVDSPDGETALETLATHPPFDVLVTDMTMPGIDGCELAERVRDVCPDLRVVLVSGYVPENDRLDGLDNLTFLPKPFTPGDLVRTVAKVLRNAERDSQDTVTEERLAAV